MLLKSWEELPAQMRNDKVKPYYNALQNRKISLFCKYIFDRMTALCMIICLSPMFAVLALLIKLDSDGNVFFRQGRVTQYGKVFMIYKFRTMVNNAEAIGSQITRKNDKRITRIGLKLRGCRLDELPQLINIVKGEMSFVGTRPETIKYFKEYNDEMLATLLLPAGVTSETSIKYKDEEMLLDASSDPDEMYIKVILPKKMKLNLESILKFNFINDLKTIIKTLIAVI